MILAIRRVLCWFFGVCAFAFASIFVQRLVGLTRLVRPVSGYSPAASLGFEAVTLLAAAIFTAAWWTTRKPTAERRWWAVAAGVLLILINGAALAVLLRYLDTIEMSPAFYSLFVMWGVFVVAGFAAILCFSRRLTVSVPTPVVVARKIVGDWTHSWINKGTPWLSRLGLYAGVSYFMRWAFDHGIPIDHVSFIVIAFAASTFTVVIHECAHAVAALWLGRKLVSFHAGPILCRRVHGRWQFQFKPAGIFTGGGAMGAVPLSFPSSRADGACIALAGPLASFGLGTLLVPFVLDPDVGVNPYVWTFFAICCYSSLVEGIVNLIPQQIETGAYSDGAHLLQQITGSPVLAAVEVIHFTQATTLTQSRPRDHDPVALERAMACAGGRLGLLVRLLAAHHFEDRDEIPRALECLREAQAMSERDNIPLPVNLHNSFVISAALYARDAVAARAWWDKLEAQKPNRELMDYWLSKACVAWLEFRLSDAESAWQTADALVRSRPSCGDNDFDRDRCALLRQHLDETRGARPEEKTYETDYERSLEAYIAQLQTQ